MTKFIVEPLEFGKLGVSKIDSDCYGKPSFFFDSIVEYIRIHHDLEMDKDSFRICSVFMFLRYLDKRTVYKREI